MEGGGEEGGGNRIQTERVIGGGGGVCEVLVEGTKRGGSMFFSVGELIEAGQFFLKEL